MSLQPNSEFARLVFLRQCANHPEDWHKILPRLAAWYVIQPKFNGVFDFTVDGFIRLARLTQPSEALALINTLPDATPFQTIRDAFVAHGNREHLHTLAPERQSVVLALLDQITAPLKAQSAKKPIAKRRAASKAK